MEVCAPAATMDRRATRKPVKFTATSEMVTKPTPTMTMLILATTGPENFLLYAMYSTTHTKGMTQSFAIW